MANPNKQDAQLADANDKPMIANQQAHIADASGGATVDAEARAAIASINAALEAHGLVADA